MTAKCGITMELSHSIIHCSKSLLSTITAVKQKYVLFCFVLQVNYISYYSSQYKNETFAQNGLNGAIFGLQLELTSFRIRLATADK